MITIIFIWLLGFGITTSALFLYRYEYGIDDAWWMAVILFCSSLLIWPLILGEALAILITACHKEN